MVRKAQSAKKARSTKTRSRANGHANGHSAAHEVRKLAQPKSPMPEQHQRKPGEEARLEPRPNFKAPLYKGAGKLKKKVALITGADSGIGRAVAVLFAREGADVAFTYLEPEKGDAKETQRAIEEEGQQSLAMMGDVRNAKVCRNLVAKTVKVYSTLLVRPSSVHVVVPQAFS